MAEREPQTEYFVKGIVINEQTNKRERVLVEAHQSLEWAEKASNRMYFDEGAKFTIIFKGEEMSWQERKELKDQREAEKEQENADVPF